jgi:site-specific DNA-cytosine methylase
MNYLSVCSGVTSQNANGDGFKEEQSYTLNRVDVHGVAVTQPIVLDDQGGSVINTSQTGIVGTLRSQTHGHEPCVIDQKSFAQNKLGELREGDVFNTLNRNANASGRNAPLARQNMAVRRLTPVECERLQGFPDGYSDIKPNGKPTPDGPRYAAMGNSMAVPVMRWIGERIQMVENSQ